ncbi:hypothetical protein ACFL5H_03670, partial [Candidatus Latescibacterota bacterium]
ILASRFDTPLLIKIREHCYKINKLLDLSFTGTINYAQSVFVKIIIDDLPILKENILKLRLEISP